MTAPEAPAMTPEQLLTLVWPALRAIERTHEDLAEGVWECDPDTFDELPPPIRLGIPAEAVGSQIIATAPDVAGLNGVFDGKGIFISTKFWGQTGANFGKRLYTVAHEGLHARGFHHPDNPHGHMRFHELVCLALSKILLPANLQRNLQWVVGRRAHDISEEWFDWQRDEDDEELARLSDPFVIWLDLLDKAFEALLDEDLRRLVE